MGVKRPLSICKLLIVGNAKCGKSSMIRRFKDDAFNTVRTLESRFCFKVEGRIKIFSILEDVMIFSISRNLESKI